MTCPLSVTKRLTDPLSQCSAQMHYIKRIFVFAMSNSISNVVTENKRADHLMKFAQIQHSTQKRNKTLVVANVRDTAYLDEPGRLQRHGGPQPSDGRVRKAGDVTMQRHLATGAPVHRM